jgi:competence protein ComEC
MAKKSVVFFWAVSFLAGNAVASFFSISAVWLIISGVLSLSLYLVFRRRILLFFVALILGILSWTIHSVIQTPEPSDHPVSVSGDLVFVENKINRQLLTVRLADGALRKYKALVYVDRYPTFVTGQKILFSCKFERPKPIEEFRYDRYLALSQIYYICYRPSGIELLPETTWRYWLFLIKQFYSTSFNQHLSEPEGNVTRAMMLAERKELSTEINTEFSRAGLSHVMAISGMNMTLLVGALQALSLALGWRRSFTFGLTVIILGIYILIIGFQASAVRAAVMAVILLFSQLVHRQYDPWYVLVLIAALLTAINPLSLMYDIGWQLSFLAMVGLLFWQQKFESWLSFLPEAMGCRAIVATSLSAQVFTWPLMVYYFQTFSTIFLITNVIALPAVDIVTVAALVAPLLWWMPMLGQLVEAGVLFLVRWLLLVCSIGSSLPIAAVTIPQVSFFWYALLYILLSIVTWYGTSREEA